MTRFRTSGGWPVRSASASRASFWSRLFFMTVGCSAVHVTLNNIASPLLRGMSDTHRLASFTAAHGARSGRITDVEGLCADLVDTGDDRASAGTVMTS